MNRKIALAAIFSALVLASLSNTKPAYAAPPKDACALLTSAQVSAVLGVTVGAGTPLTPTSTNLCHWGTANPTGKGPKKGLMLTLQNPLAFAYAKMPAGHGIVKVPVSGIGDDAVYGTSPGYPTVLTVKKGDVVFVVHVNGFPDDEIKAKEKQLALDVLAKL